MTYFRQKFSLLALALFCVSITVACNVEIVTLAPVSDIEYSDTEYDTEYIEAVRGPTPPIGRTSVLAYPARAPAAASPTINDNAAENAAAEAAPVAQPVADAVAEPAPVEPTPTALPEIAATVDSGPPAPPVRLRIPRINVDAPVEHVGQTATGAMDVPQNVWHVAWYAPGTVPGTTGNAVMSGHLDNYRGEPTVFAYLGRLQPGDRVAVTDENRVVWEFEVTEIASYGWNEAPLLKVFGPDEVSDLNLITCGGTWNDAAQNYSERLVVYTRLVAPGE